MSVKTVTVRHIAYCCDVCGREVESTFIDDSPRQVLLDGWFAHGELLYTVGMTRRYVGKGQGLSLDDVEIFCSKMCYVDWLVVEMDKL